MKKLLSLILALALVFMLAACGSAPTAPAESKAPAAEPAAEKAPEAPAEKNWTIGVLYLDQEVLMSECSAGCQAYAAEHPNVTLVEYNANKDVTAQLQQCENLISQGVDAIAITPVDGNGCDQIISACADAKIPLICFHARVNGAPITNILFDNVGFGKLQVDYAMEVFKAKGGDTSKPVNVAIVTGKLDNQNAVERCQGYDEALANYNVNLVDQQVGSWNRDAAMAIAENWIIGGEPIDIILSNNDAMAIGISLAYTNASVERPIIVGVGGTEEGLTAIMEGAFDGTVFQPAYQNGYDGIDYTVQYLEGVALNDTYVTAGTLVTPETAQATLDELLAMLNG